MAGRSDHTSRRDPDSPVHNNIWRGSPSRMESAASWDSMMESLSLRPPTTSNSPSRDNMWRGLPSTRASAVSWDSMMGLLSLGSAPCEESSPSRDSPPRRQQHPFLSECASSRPIPLAQPHWRLSNLTEQTPLRHLSSGQPPGPRSQRPDQYGSSQPQVTTSLYTPFFAPKSQPSDITTPPPNPPYPPADHIAMYLVVYEVRNPGTHPTHATLRSRRSGSIIVQSHPGSNKFREFCCIPTPYRHPKRHIQFYSSPEIPDPRHGSPGLLAMQFVARIPHRQMAELDKCMITLRYRVRPAWTHLTWIRIYLEDLLKQKIITLAQMEEAIRFEEQALDSPWRGSLPNRRECFPHLYD
ncbi:hypothetical protein GJ744_006892 [Endocarpon pusillum]|uniref:Uncharacterized protein n=1 Tax=Endocarpon pusillum TaxID=364733 RepID=A0A8H7AN88_9EURO|nr:hypothetical protein GJ744_006892 [Endocarpon pusillum]